MLVTEVFDEVQLAVVVRSCVERSLYVPVAVNCCVFPAATEAVLGVTAIDWRTGAVPVPVRLASCGLESPLSTTVSVADRVPWTLGVKIMEIVQEPRIGRVTGLTGQLLVWLKSARLALMLLMVIAELCPFFSVSL
jgi:hypothetical protein